MISLALALSQALPANDSPPSPPPPPKWEDIPRPFRTAAEDCVWAYVQEHLESGENLDREVYAEQIGRGSVEARDESLSAWAADLSKREMAHGELPEFTNSRVQSHMAARAKEFALGISERFYIDEDRGEDTQPTFRMSRTCDAQIRRALQVRHNVLERVEEMRDAALEERQALRDSSVFIELMSDIDLSENRIRLVQRRCPQLVSHDPDSPAPMPKDME